MPKHPPSERNRAIAIRRAAGATFKAIGAEFGIQSARAKEIAERVNRYDRGMAILQTNPSSFEGLELIGKLHRLTRQSLEAYGIRRIEDLDELSLADLLRLPNVGRRTVTVLMDLRPQWPRH